VARRPVVFIDRDGTLTEEVGYVNHPSRLRLLARSGQAVRRLNEAGIAAVVATNQAGIARGYFSEEVMDAVHERLVEALKDEGAHLDGVYVCPHHPTEGVPPFRADCDCRKPKPGLLLRAARDLDLDLDDSYMVGDKASDLQVAPAVGARAILVLTGYGRGEWEHRREHFSVTPDHVAADLLDAVDWVIGGMRTRVGGVGGMRTHVGGVGGMRPRVEGVGGMRPRVEGVWGEPEGPPIR
jgi:D-glycero-D-manno-heptose 1,7-bisphosphate phosphatase